MDHKPSSITCLNSCRDPESGLYTPGHFQSVLSQELARLDRGERPLSLVILESLRLTGEEWSLFGRQISASLRSIDLVARLEPKRVVVLLPDATWAWSRRWIALLLAEISDHPVLGQSNVSWGLAQARPLEGRSPLGLLALAEAHLGQGDEQKIDGDLLNHENDLDTSIATDERDLLFAGFQALTEIKH